MVDISMCNNPNCKLCKDCYRYNAKPSKYQSFIIIKKDVNSLDDCSHYWPFDNEEELKRLEEVWQD